MQIAVRGQPSVTRTATAGQGAGTEKLNTLAGRTGWAGGTCDTGCATATRWSGGTARAGRTLVTGCASGTLRTARSGDTRRADRARVTDITLIALQTRGTGWTDPACVTCWSGDTGCAGTAGRTGRALHLSQIAPATRTVADPHMTIVSDPHIARGSAAGKIAKPAGRPLDFDTLSGRTGCSGRSGWSGDTGWPGRACVTMRAGRTGIAMHTGRAHRSGVTRGSGCACVTMRAAGSGVAGCPGRTDTAGWTGRAGRSGQSGRAQVTAWPGEPAGPARPGRTGVTGWSGFTGTRREKILDPGLGDEMIVSDRSRARAGLRNLEGYG
jgi:hypothetical protein